MQTGGLESIESKALRDTSCKVIKYLPDLPIVDGRNEAKSQSYLEISADKAHLLHIELI